MTGQTFGELKVIALSEHRKEGRRTWECLCSCGKKVRVTTHDLRSGHCVSCGASEHKIGRAFSDLTGKRIGKLLVQASTDKRDKKGSVIWKCRCDCGQECEYSQDSLIHGGVVSCGCYRRTVNVAWDMHVTYPGQYLTYEQNWLEFITRFNEILPTMPIYSNIYFDFFTDWLQNYEPATYYSWPVAILYAYYAEPEEPVEVTPLPGEEETEAPAGDDEIIIID